MNRRFLSTLAVFLRFFFYHFYRSLSWSYDLVAWVVSMGQWNDWVRSCLPYVQGPNVLELGHGPGHLQVALAVRGWLVYGIDESRQMGRKAYRRITGGGLLEDPSSLDNRKPHLSRASATAIPFSNETFNTIVATFPTDYIFKSDTLSEVTRVLKPEGQLIILLSASITDKRLPHRFFSWLFRITGETRDYDDILSQSFSGSALSFSTRWLPVRTSQVLMITAKKIAHI